MERETDINKVVPCKYCGKETRMLGTQLCDACWELETRIYVSKDVVRKVLEKMAPEMLKQEEEISPEARQKLYTIFKQVHSGCPTCVYSAFDSFMTAFLQYAEEAKAEYDKWYEEN